MQYASIAADGRREHCTIVVASGGEYGFQLQAQESGVFVKSLQANGQFAAAGVRVGDRLVSICGDEIHEPDDAWSVLGEVPPGSFEMCVERVDLAEMS